MELKIDFQGLLEMAERNGCLDSEYRHLLEERTKLKDQISDLKNVIMNREYLSIKDGSLDPTDNFTSQALTRFICCGITYSDILSFLIVKKEESEKKNENSTGNAD